MKPFSLFALLLFSQMVFAQQALPVIRANSKKVAINDGGYLDENAWFLSPAARPDIYTADRTRKTKWVTFYTDVDSIRVKVKPGTRFNFVILLNGKDSCFTQIASAIPPEEKNKNVDTHDTIPFVLTASNIIHVKAIMNDTATLNLHFDLGSLGFHITKDALLAKGKPHKLKLGTITWSNPSIGSTNLTARDMDGRFGWDLFEGKSVEIDYEKNILVIHAARPVKLKGYRKEKLLFMHSFICIKGILGKNNTKLPGYFMLDTGFGQSLILDSGWAEAQNFTDGLELISSKSLYDPRGVKYETRIVSAPAFQINQYNFTKIPALVLPGKNPAGFAVNFLGTDLLKRFNMIFDFKNDYAYMKPNKLYSLSFSEK